MNQFVAKRRDGTPVLQLDLEPANLHRLQQGKPISVDIHGLFPDGLPRRLALVISYTETPIQDARELAERAEVAIDERTAAMQNVKPHCPECRSTLEQIGVWKNESPFALVFCAVCGCTLGTVASSAEEPVSAAAPSDSRPL